MGVPILFTLFYQVPTVTLFWDMANVMGYIATGIFLLLFIYVSRPHSFPPFSRYFFTHFHRDMGIAALLLVAAHILILLIAEPLLLEHLKLTAPWYMLAGLAGTILMLLLIITSLMRYRKKIWRDNEQFRKVHKWLSVLTASLIAAHLIGSNYYMRGLPKQLLLATITFVVMIYYVVAANDNMAKIENRIAINKNTSAYISLTIILILSIASLILLFINRGEI